MHQNWNALSYLPASLAVQNPYRQDTDNQDVVPVFAPQRTIVSPERTPATPEQPPLTQQEQEIYAYPQNLPSALKLIEDAVSDENEDRLFYQYLIDNAPTEQEKEIIRGIRENEITHYGLFRQIYSQLTGKMLPVSEDMPVEAPVSYCAGLKKAVSGEQNAVTKYRRILFAMQNRVHINMLTEIITDELRHGILYNYLYAKNSCKD